MTADARRADHSTLLPALRRRVTLLEKDLRERSDDPDVFWSADLRREYDRAVERERTALTWSSWRDGEVAQAAVAWVLACTFIRFCEDNHLLDGHPTAGDAPVWIAGPGGRTREAVENEQAHYERRPTDLSTDWLHVAFDALASLPAGKALLDRDHNPVYRLTISEPAAKALLEFWRTTDATGAIEHDFTDLSLDTRFLGDLYQDLSDHAKKTYALLQTPEFVEEFILDRTLTPAIAEFGVNGLRLIDPTCGSGHFLLGAFHRIAAEIEASEPGLPARQRIQRALASVNGVDLNPFAVAIARFRLTIAALRAAGDTRLTAAPDYRLNLAIGDSLLGASGTQDVLDLTGENNGGFEYASEDLEQFHGILTHGRYHVVVGNPPYIVPKDPAASAAYRKAYPTCHRQYALSVPFMELFFRLAKRQGADGGAGHVGQITANSFMKREFGKKLIEEFLSGRDLVNPVDLTEVIDTADARIPGHGTPTVILIGRRRQSDPAAPIRAVLGVRGDNAPPAPTGETVVWREMVHGIDRPGFDGKYVTVADLDRKSLTHHPWSLSGGGASDLMEVITTRAATTLAGLGPDLGFAAITGEDDVFLAPARVLHRQQVEKIRAMVLGDEVRDFAVKPASSALFPYDDELAAFEPGAFSAGLRWMWPYRQTLLLRKRFGVEVRTLQDFSWYEFREFYRARLATPLTITFAFVATHNHFALDRGGRLFNRSAPVIKLAAEAREEEHFALLSDLNSSTACFWLKEVSHDKGGQGVNEGAKSEAWEKFYEFTGTKLEKFPIPSTRAAEFGRSLDALAHAVERARPGAAIAEGTALAEQLAEGHRRWAAARERSFFEQEELDWNTYHRYGLTAEPLTIGVATGDVETADRRIGLGERAFEIALARRMDDNSEQSTWFERHASTPRIDLPERWSADYRALVERRLVEIESNPHIRLLERPEYKRRWATTPWDTQVTEALKSLALDRLEQSDLWRDGRGATPLSVAQLADKVRTDDVLAQALALLAGSAQYDPVATLSALLKEEAVPFAAAYRLTDAGMTKFRDWQQVWALQRREDAGETVTIPVPPRYAQADFRPTAAWRARGKLDVPKERFISYPAVTRAGDTSPVIGWAGWDHADQALALARTLGDQQAQGASTEALTPLLVGLAELEPWLHQWHADYDAARGGSPAQSITGLLDHTLTGLGLTRLDLDAWRPPAPPRGRRPRSTAAEA